MISLCHLHTHTHTRARTHTHTHTQERTPQAISLCSLRVCTLRVCALRVCTLCTLSIRVCFSKVTPGGLYVPLFPFVTEKQRNSETQKKAKLLPLSRLDSHFE